MPWGWLNGSLTVRVPKAVVLYLILCLVILLRFAFVGSGMDFSDMYLQSLQTVYFGDSLNMASLFNYTYYQQSVEEETQGGPRLAIFYNIFIARQDVANGLRIVREQLESRKQSPILADTTIYYSHIGDINATLPPCDPCEQITAVEQGDEVLTLQALYEYCEAHPIDGRVVYIHDKGSFTKTQNNELLREVLTKAAFSEECIGMPQETSHFSAGSQEDPEQYCDICVAQFNIVPFFHTVGNMFVAECSYIVKLIPPKQFLAAKERLMDRVWNMSWSELGFPRQPKKRLDWQFERSSWVGVERYAMEHWVFSHPLARPCEVFNVSYSYRRPPQDPAALVPNRRRAPASNTSCQEAAGFHEWFKRPGRLFEYDALYGQRPRNSSWVLNCHPYD